MTKIVTKKEWFEIIANKLSTPQRGVEIIARESGRMYGLYLRGNLVGEFEEEVRINLLNEEGNLVDETSLGIGTIYCDPLEEGGPWKDVLSQWEDDTSIEAVVEAAEKMILRNQTPLPPE